MHKYLADLLLCVCPIGQRKSTAKSRISKEDIKECGYGETELQAITVATYYALYLT